MKQNAWEANNPSAGQEIPIILPCLQKPDICSHPKPDQSSPPPILLLQDPFEYYRPIYA